MRPGSLAWLLAHEARLAWRGVGGRGRRLNVTLVGMAVVMLVCGLPIGLMLARVRLPAPLRWMAVLVLDLGLLMVFTLMLSATMTSAILVFHTRGDLDLLLSSPLDGRKVLAARAAGLAAGAFLLWASLATPFLLPVALLGHWRLLGLYPTVAALALLAAAAGISLAMTLFRLVGPRAAKTVGQVLAAVIGASLYLGSQATRLAPGGPKAMAAIFQAGRAGGLMGRRSPLVWPGRAALGDPLALAAMLALALGLFGLTVQSLGRRFVADAAVSAGLAADGSRTRPDADRPHAFAGSTFVAVMRKERRILLRDPALLSQTLIRALYLLPLTFVFLTRHDGSGTVTGAVAGPAALLAGQIAGNLTGIALAGEDAPDLIATSPVRAVLLRRAKLAAALQPTGLIMILPVAGLTLLSPWIGLAAAIGSTAAAICAGLVNLWLYKPERPRGLDRRRGSLAIVLAELGLGLGWALATGLLAIGSWWCLVPTVLTLLALGGLKAVAEPDRGL
jgi:ABC-2 type transport system permease protein